MPSSHAFGFLIIVVVIIQWLLWAVSKFLPVEAFSQHTGLTLGDMLNPGVDHGYPEYFQYILLLWLATLAFVNASFSRRWQHIWVSLLYACLLFEDALGLKDYFGALICSTFINSYVILLPAYIKPEICAILFWFLASVSLIPLLYTIIKSRKSDKILNCFVFFVISLFIFSVIVDFFVDLVPYGVLRQLLWLIEEIGEVTTIAIAVIYNFNVLQKYRRLH